MEFEQVSEVVEVPRHSGKEGFVQLIRTILNLGHVQDIHVQANGKVTYKYLAAKDVERPAFNPEQLFERVSPSCVVRNSILQEIVVDVKANAMETLFRVMRIARLDRVETISWVTGADTILPVWLTKRSTIPEDVIRPYDVLMGLPVWKDRMLPDESLILCCGSNLGADLADTTHSYKIAMVLP
jgi:hypothetical protein